jgi:DNA-binding transcriptional LysR family regulator
VAEGFDLLFISDLSQTSWTLVGPSGEQVSVPVSGSLQSGDSGVLFSALQAGLGVGMCGDAYLRGAGEQEGLVRLLPGWTLEPIPLYAVFPRSNRRSPLIDAFLEEVVRGLQGWL